MSLSIVQCLDCGEDRENAGHGRCRRCYMRHRRASGIGVYERVPKIEQDCIDCGETMLVYPGRAKERCELCRRKHYYRDNRERIREYQATPAAERSAFDNYLRRTYGITVEDYEQKLREQGGVCAICGASDARSSTIDRFVVDHDHGPISSTVRGLLCVPCNHGLGRFDDDWALVETAARYLKMWEGR